MRWCAGGLREPDDDRLEVAVFLYRDPDVAPLLAELVALGLIEMNLALKACSQSRSSL